MSKNKITRAKVENYFDETLMGPKGLISMAFRHKVKVPTMKEAKAERAQYKKEPQSNYTKKVTSILRKTFKAAAKRKTLEGQMNEIVQQMKKLSRSMDKNEKGSKLFHGLLAYMTSRARSRRVVGGGRRRRSGVAGGANGDGGGDGGGGGGGDGGAIVPHQAPLGQQDVRAALATALARYQHLVRTGAGASHEAVQLVMQIRVLQVMVAERDQMAQYNAMGWVRQLAPYVIFAAAIAFAAWASWSIVMGIEGFAEGFLLLGGGVIKYFFICIIDLVLGLVSGISWGYLGGDAAAGEDQVNNATARFLAHADGSFGPAIREIGRGIFGAEVAAGIIMFIIFVLLEGLAYLLWSGRRVRLGWGLIDIEREDPFHPGGGHGAHIPAHQLPGGQPPALPAPAPAPMITNAPHAVAPVDDEDDEGEGHVEPVEQDGGGRRRRRRRTKKRGRGRKGRSRKRSRKKKRRRSSHKRKRSSRRRRRSRRVPH